MWPDFSTKFLFLVSEKCGKGELIKMQKSNCKFHDNYV